MDNRRQSGLWTENDTGYYEQQRPNQSGPYQYYEHPTRNSEGKRRSYSDRANGEAPATYQPTQNGSQSRGSRNADARGGQNALRIDPDAVPDNLRNKAFSPDLMSPGNKQRHGSTASNAADLLRRGSVPDRSPLQKLEMEFSSKTKSDKRAKVEEAERRARQKPVGRVAGGIPDDREMVRQGTVRNEKPRIVSDGSRRPNEGAKRDERARQVSEEVPVKQETGSSKFRRATEALKNGTRSPMDGNAAPMHGNAAPETRRPVDTNREGAPLRQDITSHYGQVESVDDPADLQPTRSNSNSKYRRRARDAGFVGAAAAMAGELTAADRGRAAHERRKSQIERQNQAQASPISPTANDGGMLGRSGSKKLQKRGAAPTERDGGREVAQGNANVTREHGHATKQALQTDRLGGGGKKEAQIAMAQQEPDVVTREQVALPQKNPLNYSVPPQTAAGIDARQQVGFGAETSPVHSQLKDKHHKFGGMFHHHDDNLRSYQAEGKGLEEWRNAGVAKLMVTDLESDEQAGNISAATSAERDAAWWEKNGRRASSGGTRQAPPRQYDEPYEEEAKHFRPPLYLKCGPLLRFTGIRKQATQQSRSARSAGGGKEMWHGSIMIVTDDRQSDYSSVPTLRLFGQTMDLHTLPPKHLLESGQELPPEYEDPVAGQVKLSRTGRPLYVRHVHEIDGEVDLSREENPQGLFAATRTPMLGPQSVSGPDGRQSQHITFQDKSRVKKNVAEKAGKYREVKGFRLHVERGFTFWRFNIEIELGSRQQRIAYRINKGPAVGFWVPARGETMNIMFHSCNGFSLAVDPHLFSGPDPLWRDVLNRHQTRPFHVMLGGGDQIYNDAAMRDTTLFADWLRMKNPEHKHKAEFSAEMQEELELFYLDRYAMWFSQGLFGMANSQIPMVNMWDDHDIIDGFGSYPHHFMSSRVFTGLGAVAFKYYMLFQHQSIPVETTREEQSWLLGTSPGPYIAERSRSVFMHLGRKVAFLGLDCRTERMRDEILSQETYDVVFDRCREEIIRGETKHLIVLLGVPIAYPRLNFLENILTSKVMDPIKAIGRTGMLGGFVNKFDGGVEILDDLDDHWTAKHHKAERNWFIQELQELAAEKSVRVTILGGDVHLGAVGQFYTPKKLGVSKDRDHRYMPNIVSSAIVNTPPPVMMADVLNKRNKVHHLDHETDEDMIPMFDTDVDGSARNNKRLLPRRNYCTIREFAPGDTPPGSPRAEAGQGMFSPGEREGRGEKRYPPGSMKRTMSLTRGPVALVRRLSGSGRNKNAPAEAPGMQRANSLGGSTQDSYFPPGQSAAPQRPTNQFHRRPTSFSVKQARKAAAKGGPELDGAEERDAGHIDLQSGLDISLNMEVDQRDPGGSTVEYRLLVPALWYEGNGDPNTMTLKGHEGGFMGRLKGHGKQDGAENRRPSLSGSETPSPPPSRGQHQGRLPAAAMAGAATAGVAAQRNHNQPYHEQRPVGAPIPAQRGNDGAYDEPQPNQEAFKKRRPSFIQRLTGRGRRDADEDDYSSRSGTPSPPPNGRQQDIHYAAPGLPANTHNAGRADEGMPEQQAFKTRRPSFMQRLTGRGKREIDDDDYSSRSGSPSPPPSRGQQDMPTTAGAQRLSFDMAGGRNAGDPPPFKTRRPSFMDRLRGRNRREVGDDGYSRSPTPSPPPSSRGQQLPPQHIRGPEDLPVNAGTSRAPVTQAGRRIASDMQTTRNKGYNLASPPIGSAPQPSARAGVGNNPYPQSGIRNSSAPMPAQTRHQPLANEPWRSVEHGSDQSFTESDEYLDDKDVEGKRRQSTQVRRPSKAERFFGIGDSAGPWGGNGGNGGQSNMPYNEEYDEEPGKRKPGWKVWK
ncbi:hypothetical protein LTR56_020956 [Elasticomyces elasticus]|nr:hypothetical protein LTR56_020956 [Elasticomyces elasticus]KAK3646039.1 hypothetical protein LTR22_014474 [Elasticomyces elasticus]